MTNNLPTLAALMFPVLVREQKRFIQDGETIDRLCLDVLGHDVQLLVYNEDVYNVLVKFDNQVKQTTLTDAVDFVTTQLKKDK
ncbi:MAG: hypothetical protein ABI904_00845 [Chloroflexota bacterium]